MVGEGLRGWIRVEDQRDYFRRLEMGCIVDFKRWTIHLQTIELRAVVNILYPEMEIPSSAIAMYLTELRPLSQGCVAMYIA